MNNDIRNINHWTLEHYTQRITSKEWKELLLNGDDTLIFRGRLRKLQYENLGSGVFEISKKPLEDEDA